MKATRPEDPTHKRFITTAHVAQTWEVDEEGNFLELVSDDEVTRPPQEGNCWDCAECGAAAKVTG